MKKMKKIKYGVKCITPVHRDGEGCDEKTERGWEGWCSGSKTNDINQVFRGYSF